MQTSSKIIRPYSPSKWYDCWKYRIQNGLSLSNNKFYKLLNNQQINELNYWLTQCFMKIDMLLFHHDNHAIQLENKIFQENNDDSVKFIAKHELPKALIISTELPIGYVNFKKYHDFIKLNNENLYSDLLSNSELGLILQNASNINDNIKYNKYYKNVHPLQTFWTPKYDHIEGYIHPIWEIVDCIIEYLYRMSIYFDKYDLSLNKILTNIDNDKINDRIIHNLMIETFINRYIHKFQDKQCPNPLYEISENPPNRLISKYPYIYPLLFCDIFRIIHLNGYINQTLYLRNIMGHGLYSISSYYDHSCDPNLVYATYDGKLRMVLIKEIKKHQPLTTSYLAEFIDQIDVNQRQERLKWMGFNCQCDRCQQPQQEYPPTIWSELRYFHYILSDGINKRYSTNLFRILSFGNKYRIGKWYMKKKIRSGICDPAYECFHTLDVLRPDAAFNDILCNIALKKYGHKYFDRDTKDRELMRQNM